MSEVNTDFIQTKYGYCYFETEQGKHPIIWNLYIHTQYRKQGHARKILQYAINEIRQAGFENEIDIEADPRDESISFEKLVEFYKSLGLNVTNEFEGQEMKPEDLPERERGCGGCVECNHDRA